MLGVGFFVFGVFGFDKERIFERNYLLLGNSYDCYLGGGYRDRGLI